MVNMKRKLDFLTDYLSLFWQIDSIFPVICPAKHKRVTHTMRLSLPSS